MTDTAALSLSDVDDAQRAARAIITPWWLRFLIGTVLAAAIALAVFDAPAFTIWIGAIVIAGGYWLIQRWRGIDLVRGHKPPRSARVVAGYVASPHISELAGAQYVQIHGDTNDSLRQWISLSDAGYAAYAAHMQALRTAAPTPS